MPNCTRCNKEITQEPYYSITNEKPYCSENCLPDRAFDQLYSFEYMKLVSSYRYFESQKYYIDNFKDRVNLENEIDETIEEYKTYYLSDSENNFYKSQIIRLYENLNNLYDEVNNFLINTESESFVYYGITIAWDDLRQALEETKLHEIFYQLNQGLKNNKMNFRNLSSFAFNENKIQVENFKDVICVETEEEQKVIICILMEVIKKIEPSLIYDEISFVDYIHSGKIKNCPVCLHWEDESEFSFDEELNVYACFQWDACRNPF